MWNEQKVRVRIESSRVCRPIPTWESVFIVSGDACVRSNVQQVLAAQGLYAVTFETAAEYRASVKPDVPTCLILDVSLPDMCGLDLQEQLGSSCPPVIFVTRHGQIAHSVRAIKAGAVDFLTMPFDPLALLGSIRSAIALDASTRARRKRLTGMHDRFARVTPRERQVMQLVVSGFLNKQVAAELGIAEITVQVHRRQAMRKLGASSFADLVRIAEFLRIPCKESPPSEESRAYAYPRTGVLQVDERRV